ncbi:MAG: GNAT family N-acetyltransferase [Acidobacteria bacterium]|nr:GNAT family N-acetyltransferase [Acidobacteriota bacterium]
MSIIVETERLVLRHWTPTDAAALFSFAGDQEVMRYIGDGLAWAGIERAHAWLERVGKSYRERGYGPWAVSEKTSGRIIGSCGFSFLPALSEVDFGYVFARDNWGRGFATEAARAALRYGFEQFGFVEVTANTVQENHASRRVLEKTGFEFRGLRHYDGDAEDSAFYVAKNPLDGLGAS